MKRFTDILFAIVGLVVFSPVMAIIAIVIKCDDKGTVIFKQERIGRKGKPFVLYKFRSMKLNAELNGTPQLSHDMDYRMTRSGRFLRSHHLDELPQLWNVIKGDMSFVGYRPERQFFIDSIMDHNPNYVKLYAVRPGLFSEATLYNGYTDSMEKMLKRLDMDLNYLERGSFWMDMKIIILTAVFIISGKKF